MKLFTITYIDNKGKECVEQIYAHTLDAATRFCGVEPGKLIDVELAMNNTTKEYHAERRREAR